MQAEKRSVAHIAQELEVGPRFVEQCFEESMQERMAKQGRTLEETAPLATPRFLGIDEFARRKGHHYETILCDLVKRTVLEVSEGRKMEEVQKLLERLDHPDAVEAVSMDMSASFRPAVQLCLPQAKTRRGSFSCRATCHEGFQEDCFQLGAQKGGKTTSAGKTVPLFDSTRRSDHRTSARSPYDWSRASRSGGRMAPQGSVTDVVCHRDR
jgi:transposase